MGNLTITLVLIVIIIIAGAIFWNQIQAPLAQAQQTFTQFLITTQIAPQAHKGQQVCNLIVHVYGEFDNPNPLDARVYLGRANYHPEVADPSWSSCFTSLSLVRDGVGPFSTIVGNESLPLDSLAVGDGNGFFSQIVLLGDDGSKIDASVQPLLRQKVLLPNGVFPTPYDFQESFVVTKVPKQHYKLQIFMGRGINNMDIGQPYTMDIS